MKQIPAIQSAMAEKAGQHIFKYESQGHFAKCSCGWTMEGVGQQSGWNFFRQHFTAVQPPQDKALREARQTIANGELSADCCAERSSLEDAKQVLATLESLLPRESGGGK